MKTFSIFVLSLCLSFTSLGAFAAFTDTASTATTPASNASASYVPPLNTNPGPLQQQGTANDPTGLNNPASGAIQNPGLKRQWNQQRAANKEIPTSKPTQNCDANDLACMQNQDISNPVR